MQWEKYLDALIQNLSCNGHSYACIYGLQSCVCGQYNKPPLHARMLIEILEWTFVGGVTSCMRGEMIVEITMITTIHMHRRPSANYCHNIMPVQNFILHS